MRQALRAANVGLWDWDLRTNRVFYSPEWKRQIGYDDGEISDQLDEWRRRVHPDDLAPALATVERHIADPNAREYAVEFRFLHRDGSWRHILTQASIERDPDGRARRLLGSHVDLTDRRRAESLRRETEASLELAHDAAGLGTWKRDLASGALVFDARALGQYGFDSPVQTFARVVERIHADDRERIHATVEAAIAPGGAGRFSVEYRIVHPGGDVRWLAVSGVLVHAGDGASRAPAFLIGVSQDVTDRKAREEASRTAAALFTTAFESSPAPLVITRAGDGRIVQLNARFEQLAGIPRAEILGHSVLELGLVRPEVVRPFWHDTDAGRPPRGVEIDFESRLGTKRVGVTMAPLHLEDGAHRLVLLQDVTELRAAERALADGEERLRLAIEAADLGTWDWDIVTDVRTWSPRFREIYGLEPGSPPAPATVLRRIHPGDLAGIERVLAGALDPSGDGVFETEYRVYPAEGVERWVSAHGRAIFEGEAGSRRAVRMLGTVRDITAQKRAEAELVRLNERFALAVRAAALGVWDWDIASNTLVWDDQMYALYGVGRGQFAGAYEAWLAGVHPADRERADLASKRAVNGEQAYDTEFRVVWPDGTVRHLHAQGTVTRDADGRPVRMIGVNRDITDRKRAEQEVRDLNATLEQRVADRTAQLTAANAELESFSYSVSHDLRAPVRAIDGFTRIIAERYADRLDDSGRGYLGRITAATDRMAQLIDDLLNLARVARTDLVRQPTDLTALAREVLDRLQQAEPRRQVRATVADGLVARADPRLLRVVLENLLGNAWKFTSRRDVAHIEVGCVRGNGTPSCFVRDDGAGFDMKYAARLFTPFQRLHPASEYPGTGIGLAIVQRIVQRHGGRAWAEAEVGRGATFHFSIPD